MTNGMNSIVVSSPNSKAETRRNVAATIGIARIVICVPKTLTVCAVHSFRKSRFRRTLGSCGYRLVPHGLGHDPDLPDR